MFRRIITAAFVLAAALIAPLAMADKKYVEVYRQDFDEFATYTNNCQSGSLESMLLGTTYVAPKALTPDVKMAAWDVESAGTKKQTVISKQSRTKYDTKVASDYLLFYMYGNLTDGMVYDLSANTKDIDDYKVEFDYYLGPSFNTTATTKHYTGTNGLVIAGSSSTLATFAVLPASASGTPVATLYRGDSYTPLAEGLSTGLAGTYNTEGKWFHIVIVGDEVNGVVMTVTQEDGTVVLDGVTISDDFQSVNTLYAHAGAAQKRHCFCLDDVVVSKVPTVKVYKTVFEQDFDEFATYTNNCQSGSLESMLLGTTYVAPKALTPEVKMEVWDVESAGTKKQTVISKQSRVKYDTKALSDYLLFYMYGNLTDGMVYDLSTNTKDIDDYKVEFDYYLGPSFNTTATIKHYTGTNGLVIAGSSSTLATFTVLPASASGTPVATLYRGDSYTPLAEGLSTGLAGTYNTEGKWFHIVIAGDKVNGVVMTVTQEDGTVVLDGVTISTAFQSVKTLFAHAGAAQKRHCFCFDDVKVMMAMSQTTCVWTGASDNKWDNHLNWTNQEGEVVGAYHPAASDIVIIDKPNQSIVLNASEAKKLEIDVDVTFSNAVVAAELVCGAGVVTLSDNTGFVALESDLTVDNDIIVLAADDAPVLMGGRDDSSAVVANFGGKVAGSGAISVQGTNSVVTMHGDWGDFGGTVGFDCRAFFLTDDCYGSANAVWNIVDCGATSLANDDRDFSFGALNGKLVSTEHSGTIEIGALAYGKGLYASGVSELSGGSLAKHTVRKVGGDSLTVADITVGAYAIDDGTLAVCDSASLPTEKMVFGGGVLKLSDPTLDPSALIVDSTGPIAVDYGGSVLTNVWASPLAESNGGGLVKDGDGTLRLSVLPQYSGDTVVSNGVLIIPWGAVLGAVRLTDFSRLVVDLTGAGEKAYIFSATSSNVALTNRLEFINKPVGYVIDMVANENGGVTVVTGSNDYTWSSEDGDDRWAYKGNWLPEGIPDDVDNTFFLNEEDTIVTTKVDTVDGKVMTLSGSGDLCLGGSYTLTTLLNFALTGNLVLDAGDMAKSDDEADYYGSDLRLGLTAKTAFSAKTIGGDGNLTVVNCDLVASADDEDATNRFVGTLTAPNLVKTGKGTFDFVGEGVINNAITVNEGTLRLGTYRDIEGFRMDFDASDATSFSTNKSGLITSWRSADGNYAFDYADGQHATLTKDSFGGKNAMLLRPGLDATEKNYSRYLLSPGNDTTGLSSKSLFLVYEPVSMVQFMYIYADSKNDSHGLSANTSLKWDCTLAGYGDRGIFTGISYGSGAISAGSRYLTFWSDSPITTEKSEFLGSASSGIGFSGAIGEVVSFTRALSHIEREVITRQLMRKWGLGYTDGGAIRSTTAVTMKPGAVIDLAGQDLIAKSFIGAGIVTNGVLRTKNGEVTQSGGTLTYPAIDGYNYVVTEVGQTLRLTEGTGKKLKITIPRSAFKPGTTGRKSIFCQGDITWDIGRDVKPIDEGNGWWTIPAGGFTLRLR